MITARVYITVVEYIDLEIVVRHEEDMQMEEI